MKKLKNRFPYRLIILFCISIYLNNIFIFISILLYILLFYRKYFIYYCFFIIIFLFITKNDFINIGIVDDINNEYIVVNKILYKSKMFNANYKIGDVILTKSSIINNNIYDLKNNIRFIINNNETELLFNNSVKYSLYNYISNINNSEIYKKILYNKYSYDVTNDFEYISLSYSFYYLLTLIFKKNRNLSIILLIFYSSLFSFQTKFIILIINYILCFFDFDNIEKISYKILLIIFINKFLILNYSFIYGILISILILNNNGKLESYLLALCQSFLYGNINVLNCFLYRYFIYEKIIMFFITVYSLIFKDNIIIKFLNFNNQLYSKWNINIRGKINILIIIIILLIFYIFKVKNEMFKLLIVFGVCLSPYNMLFTQVDFIDVGQGDSTLIIDSSSLKTILIDTGSNYYYSRLKKELFNKGIYKIDYLIITHDDSDHNGNIDNIKKDFIIDKIIYDGVDIRTNSLYFKYLDIKDRKYSNDNDSSLVYELFIDNYSFLFTGDISSNIENNIIFNHKLKDIDVLKVSHHGSNTATSNYFVGSLNPEFAIISTSGMYGHPHKNVIETLSRYKVNTYITKNDGNVNFIFTRLIDYIKTNNRFVIISK